MNFSAQQRPPGGGSLEFRPGTLRDANRERHRRRAGPPSSPLRHPLGRARQLPRRARRWVVDSRAAPEVGNRDRRRRSAHRGDRRYRPARLPRRLDGDDGRDARCPFQALGLAGRRGPRGPELVDNPVGRAAAGLGRRTRRPRAPAVRRLARPARPTPLCPSPGRAQVALALHRFRAAAPPRGRRPWAAVPWQPHRPPPSPSAARRHAGRGEPVAGGPRRVALAELQGGGGRVEDDPSRRAWPPPPRAPIMSFHGTVVSPSRAGRGWGRRAPARRMSFAGRR